MATRSNAHSTKQFYENQAGSLLLDYERVAFEQVHGDLLPFIARPGAALDIGAGSGRDASYLAERGWRVIAVEPSTALLRGGRMLHRNENLLWMRDSLPELKRVKRLRRRFDLVLLSAVWMHIDRRDEPNAADTVAELCSMSGSVSVTLKIALADPTRGAMSKDPNNLIALFEERSLRLVSDRSSEDLFSRSSATWRALIFQRSSISERTYSRNAMSESLV